MYENIPEYLEHLPVEVLKAIDGSGQAAQALERQDLEADVERLNILETPFFDRLGKVQATAYEHEYTLVTSRHDKIGYAVYRDGGLPRSVDVDVARRRTLPSLIGHRITITELAQATTRAGVQTAEETARTEKIVAVMEETEYLNFYGDRRLGSTNMESPQNLQYDGIENIVKRGAPQNVTDAGGAPLSLGLLWAAENKVYTTQGRALPNTVYISPVDKINLQQAFYQISRIVGSERVQGSLGVDAQTYISAFGESELVTSRFLGDFHKYSDQGFGNTGGEYSRPGSVTIDDENAVTNPNANDNDGLEAGTYTYAVKAFNFNGESEATEMVAPVTVTAGQAVEIELTNISSGTKGFWVFRKDGNDGEFKFLKKVPYYSGSTFTIIDDGHENIVSAYGTFSFKRLPGTGIVAGVDHRTTSMAQWIPLEQVQLPRVLTNDMAIRHVTSLFSRAPEFNFLIVNVGQNPLS